MAIPNIATCLAHYSSSVVATLSISSLGDSRLLAAYGLANLIWYVFGISFGSGLTSALDTLVSQSLGAGNHHLLSVHLNRARIVILTIGFLPALAVLLFTDQVLVFSGQDVAVATYAADFIKGASLGLIPLYLNFCSAAYLRSIKRPKLPLVANIAAACVHIAPCILMVNHYGLGLYGAGLAASLNSWTRFLFLEVYLHIHPELGGHQWTPEAMSLSGLIDYIALALPSAALYCSESWAFELQAMVAGWVSTEGLASHVAGVSVICIAFRLPQGMSQSLATLVGASLGKGKPGEAEAFRSCGLFMTLIASSAVGLAVFVFKRQIASIYSTDASVVSVLDPVMIQAAFFIVVDAFATVQEGVLRGLKLQPVAMKYKLFSMFVVMLPTSLALSRFIGVPGIWLGSTLGVSSSSFWYNRILSRCDFAERSAIAIKDNQG